MEMGKTPLRRETDLETGAFLSTLGSILESIVCVNPDGCRS